MISVVFLVLQPVSTQNGQHGMALVPYAQWNPLDKEIPFERTSIESISGAGDLERSYLEITSGIGIAPAGSNVSQFRRP